MELSDGPTCTYTGDYSMFGYAVDMNFSAYMHENVGIKNIQYTTI